jgi:hypothetical protein
VQLSTKTAQKPVQGRPNLIVAEETAVSLTTSTHLAANPAVFANRRQHFARFFDDISFSQIRAAVTRTIPGPSVLSRKSITLAYG